jgi:hypothetical protein
MQQTITHTLAEFGFAICAIIALAISVPALFAAVAFLARK